MATTEKLSAAQEKMLARLRKGEVVTDDAKEKRTIQALHRKNIVGYTELGDGRYKAAVPAYKTDKTDSLTPNKRKLVDAVKAHAAKPENYENGWSTIVEAWSDEDIAKALGYTYTVKGAIDRIAEVASVYADREADAKNSQ